MAKSPVIAWIWAARPKTLWAAVAPVLIGTAMAHGNQVSIDGWSLACALFGALLIQIGTNFANDYFDFMKGTDTANRIGPLRATQAGLIRPDLMRRAFLFTFGFALIPGAYIIWRGGWPFVAIGVLSIISGILYTGGPYPLGYLGLGDGFVLIFFGPVAVGGTYYLHALDITSAALIAGVASGLFSVAILAVNNMRDIDEDRRAGKKTLAVRFGRTFARVEYVLCIVIAAFVIPLYFYAETESRLFALVPLVVIPMSMPAIKIVLVTVDGPALNGVLAKTGKILLLFSLVFSLGWILL
ncbi:MAG: 1,4-dihydroxy-2-naphthoate polyprenyltransferase [Candidatus Hydrogenedentes bacterium]|nr:1,4-dihydroxy-2-naphthoate polyprenyltransferase [Candidatus Hydrogenedentota bacterium]